MRLVKFLFLLTKVFALYRGQFFCEKIDADELFLAEEDNLVTHSETHDFIDDVIYFEDVLNLLVDNVI